MRPQKRKIEYVDVEKLRPYQQNPRRHPRKQIEQIAASIRRFGFNVPLIIDAKNRVAAGHGRLLAAQKLRLTKVPVIRAKNLTDKERRAFMLADNKLAEGSSWDDELLQFETKELRAVGVDLQKIGVESLKELSITNDKQPKQSAAQTYGGITSLQRGSVPIRYWRKNKLLKGAVLDFGSGHDHHEFGKYDAFSQPDTGMLLKSWDTIMCNYVLNVQPADHLIVQVCALMARMLRPGGRVLIAARNDLKRDRHSARGHQLAKSRESWTSLLQEVFVVKDVEPSGFYGFICSRRNV